MIRSLILSLAFISVCHAEQATVLRVMDGDTLEVKIGETKQKVRMANIDAPEKLQVHGVQSKISLCNMVCGKTVNLDKGKLDKYGRRVSTVKVWNKNINKAQVRNGDAWVYHQYLTDKTYIPLEEKSKKAKRGLWQQENPQPPWEYRKAKH